jgi:aminomethyltransferase
MAIGTPLHSRTEPLCHSYDWMQWSGYLSVSSYNDFVQPEYASIRNSAALIDLSPLYKYAVSGADAAALVDRIVTHDAAAMSAGQVVYTPWCDPSGMVRQEGTVFRYEEDRFEIYAAEPAFEWIRRNAVGYQVEVTDRSAEVAMLSLQGPHSRAVLDAATDGAIGGLGFFRCTPTRIAGVDVAVSRTGFTGDLGYEIWIPADEAVSVWDRLMEVGAPWQITPCGLVAMDIARVEAGLILISVDYVSSEFAHTDDDLVTPYELGLGWAVKLDRGNFVGRKALRAAKQAGPRRCVVGLEIEWQPLEEAFMAADLMPELPMTVCREPVPIYSDEGRQVGRATSKAWSKLLKKYIALATLDADRAQIGSRVEMEVTVQYRRCRVAATVVDKGFFRPARMRA